MEDELMIETVVRAETGDGRVQGRISGNYSSLMTQMVLNEEKKKRMELLTIVKDSGLSLHISELLQLYGFKRVDDLMLVNENLLDEITEMVHSNSFKGEANFDNELMREKYLGDSSIEYKSFAFRPLIRTRLLALPAATTMFKGKQHNTGLMRKRLRKLPTLLNQSADEESDKEQVKESGKKHKQEQQTSEYLEMCRKKVEDKLVAKLQERWQETELGVEPPGYDNVSVAIKDGRVTAAAQCLICHRFFSVSVVENSRVSVNNYFRHTASYHTVEASMLSDMSDLSTNLGDSTNKPMKTKKKEFSGKVSEKGKRRGDDKSETPAKKQRENQKQEHSRFTITEVSSAAPKKNAYQDRNCVGCDVKPGTLKIAKSMLMADIFRAITGIQTVNQDDSLCTSCESELKICFDFRTRCRKINYLYQERQKLLDKPQGIANEVEGIFIEETNAGLTREFVKQEGVDFLEEAELSEFEIDDDHMSDGFTTNDEPPENVNDSTSGTSRRSCRDSSESFQSHFNKSETNSKTFQGRFQERVCERIQRLPLPTSLPSLRNSARVHLKSHDSDAGD